MPTDEMNNQLFADQINGLDEQLQEAEQRLQDEEQLNQLKEQLEAEQEHLAVDQPFEVENTDSSTANKEKDVEYNVRAFITEPYSQEEWSIGTASDGTSFIMRRFNDDGKDKTIILPIQRCNQIDTMFIDYNNDTDEHYNDFDIIVGCADSHNLPNIMRISRDLQPKSIMRLGDVPRPITSIAPYYHKRQYIVASLVKEQDKNIFVPVLFFVDKDTFEIDCILKLNTIKSSVDEVDPMLISIVTQYTESQTAPGVMYIGGITVNKVTNQTICFISKLEPNPNEDDQPIYRITNSVELTNKEYPQYNPVAITIESGIICVTTTTVDSQNNQIMFRNFFDEDLNPIIDDTSSQEDQIQGSEE